MSTVVESQSRTRELKPLGISCTSTDCDNGLHCFRQTVKMRQAGIRGVCRECWASLVNWRRIERRDLSDVDYTFAALQHELIRHHFWHKALDERAVNHARRRGRIGMREAAMHRIRKSVASPDHPRQGRQTPFAGNALYYAQHAVAACCRACIEEWYAIPRDRELTEDEIRYLAELTSRYVELRIPDLSEHGEKVPPIRSPGSASARSREVEP